MLATYRRMHVRSEKAVTTDVASEEPDITLVRPHHKAAALLITLSNFSAAEQAQGQVHVVFPGQYWHRVQGAPLVTRGQASNSEPLMETVIPTRRTTLTDPIPTAPGRLAKHDTPL